MTLHFFIFKDKIERANRNICSFSINFIIFFKHVSRKGQPVLKDIPPSRRFVTESW